jgi:hypothetical protein
VKVLIATLILIVSLAADEQPVKPQDWQNPALWHKIKAGQTPEESVKLLGDPIETESSKAIEVWYYSDTPQADENGRMIRPKHGFLMFRKTPTGNTLQKWMEPDWQTLPTWDKLQADYKQALADQRAAEIAEHKRIAEAAATARAEQAEERKHISAETTAQRKQQQKAQVTPRRERKQTTKRAPTPAAKPDTHTRLMSRYFIIIGGVFVVMAVIVGGTYGYKQFNT